MEQKPGQNFRPQKTTANRILLFFIIGFTSIIPLWFVSFFLTAILVMFLLPIVVLAYLIIATTRETRISEVKPRWLEIFLAALGAFYPAVVASIALWLLWWTSFGLAVLFGAEWELNGAAFNFASILFGVLSLSFAIFLVRMNWRHLLNQLYPQVGTQSAFAQISATGKRWLLKRGIIISSIFLIVLAVFLVFFANNWVVSDTLTVENLFLIGLFFILFNLFFISMSAWLWLREPEIPRGVEVTNQALARVLQPMGYEVQTLVKVKGDPKLEVEISDRMTASVDLIARGEGDSLVIDVMTREETLDSADWIAASEFRMATWYLQSALQLPTPVKAVFVIVDVMVDDSLFSFAESHDIIVIRLSGEEVVELLAQDMSKPAIQKKTASLFSPLSNNIVKMKSQIEPVLATGGRDG